MATRLPTLLAAALLCVAPVPGRAAAAAPHPRLGPKQACVSKQCHAALGSELKAAASAHDPASSDECGSCHDLALAEGKAFVKGAHVAGSPGGKPWDVALCAECHAEKLLAKEGAGGSTRFADGGRDLHWLHVRASQGRGCLTCHDPHAAAQASLLRTEIPSQGKAKIRQVFRAEKDGGSCQTGCHAPKRYER